MLFWFSWIHSPVDLSLFWKVMIRLWWIACLHSVDLCILLFLQWGFVFTLWVINQMRRLNLRVQSPGQLWYIRLGLVPTLMGLCQYSFCQRSLLSCLVVVLHLKESIPTCSACAHDNIAYQTDIKPTTLLTYFHSNHLLSQLLLWPVLLSELWHCFHTSTSEQRGVSVACTV